MTRDFGADDADVLEQQRALDEAAENDDVPSADVEADSADLQEQSRAVPSEDDDRRA
ncbi:MAG TPA: hypothetical protein VH969_24985 [Actinophytocola sp.]|jgi:hypothetical protein|uniref:hypothetical protein n=1 Tax=Actinophytocola sp. TaxID=1872138 RepID=UPI002F91CCFF